MNASCRVGWGLMVMGTWLVACSASDMSFPGRSTKVVEAPKASPARNSNTLPIWEHHADISGYRRVDHRMLPSAGHNHPFWRSQVMVNAQGAMEYLREPFPGRMPTGSILVEIHEGLDGQAPMYAMVKHPPGFDTTGGDWEYVVMWPDGQLEARGNARQMAACARCHAEAPVDRVFGPRAETRRALSVSSRPSPSVAPEDEAASPDENATVIGKPALSTHQKKRKR